MMPKRRYLSYLRERWWVVLITLTLAIGAMVTYETIHPQNYSSFAQIYLSGNLQLNVGSVFSEEALTYFGTQIELLKSARLQGAALESAGVTVPPGEKNPYKVDIIQPMKTSILQLQATGPDPALTQRFRGRRPEDARFSAAQSGCRNTSRASSRRRRCRHSTASCRSNRSGQRRNNSVDGWFRRSPWRRWRASR